eukprot:6490369-Amphidinium_carterae.1
MEQNMATIMAMLNKVMSQQQHTQQESAGGRQPPQPSHVLNHPDLQAKVLPADQTTEASLPAALHQDHHNAMRAMTALPPEAQTLFTWAPAPGDGSCLWHALSMNAAGGTRNFKPDQGIAFKTRTLTQLSEYQERVSVLLGCEQTAVAEVIQAYADKGREGDVRAIMLTAWLYGVNICVVDCVHSELLIFYAAEQFSPARPLWVLRYIGPSGHYEPGAVTDWTGFQALLACAHHVPWSANYSLTGGGGGALTYEHDHVREHSILATSITEGIAQSAHDDLSVAAQVEVFTHEDQQQYSLHAQRRSVRINDVPEVCYLASSLQHTTLESTCAQRVITERDALTSQELCASAPAHIVDRAAHPIPPPPPSALTSIVRRRIVGKRPVQHDVLAASRSNFLTVSTAREPAEDELDYDIGDVIEQSDSEQEDTTPELIPGIGNLSHEAAFSALCEASISLQADHNGQAGVQHIKLHTLNVDGWRGNFEQLLSMLDSSPHVVAVQETLVTQQIQARMSALMKTHGYNVIWGAAASQKLDAKKRWRVDRANCPGVAFVLSDGLDACPVSFHTEPAKKWFELGRLHAISLGTGNKRAMIMNIYAPSGFNQQQERRTFFQDLAGELATHPTHSMSVIGDCNSDVDQHILSGYLRTQGWRRLPLVNLQGRPTTTTYKQGEVRTHIDAIYMSPDLWPTTQHAVTRKVGTMQHRMLSCSVSAAKYLPGSFVPRPPTVVVPQNLQAPTPVDWATLAAEVDKQCRLIEDMQAQDSWHNAEQQLNQLWTSFEHSLRCHLIASACLLKNDTPATPEQVNSLGRYRTKGVRAHSHAVNAKGPIHSEHFRFLKHIGRLVSLAQHRGIDSCRTTLLHDRHFICEVLSITHATLIEHLAQPHLHISEWRVAAKKLQTRLKEQGIAKWRKTLLDEHGRPTKACYKWLRPSSLPAQFAVRTDDGLKTGPHDFFEAVTGFWASLMSRDPTESVPAQQWMWSHRPLRQPMPRDEDLLAACIKAIKIDTACGLDCWPSSALKAMPRDAYPSLLRIYRCIETTAIWPHTLRQILSDRQPSLKLIFPK